MVRRTIALLLVGTMMAIPLSACSLAGSGTPANTSPFTTAYTTSAGDLDFFLANDDADTIISGGPFYPGSRQLPSQSTAAFDVARARKVVEVAAAADGIVVAYDAAKPKLAALRTAYAAFLDVLVKERPKTTDFATTSLKGLTLLGTKELIAEAAYRGFADQRPTVAYARAMRTELMAAKAVELGGLVLRETNDLAGYSALVLTASSKGVSPKVTEAARTLDAAMGGLDDAVAALRPAAAGIAAVDDGVKRISMGDYHFAREASGWMGAEMARLGPKVGGLTPRDGVSAQDVADIKTVYAAFVTFKSSMDAHLAALDPGGLPTAEAPHARSGVLGEGVAYAVESPASGAFVPGQAYGQGVQVLEAPAPPAGGLLSATWGGVKKAFGAAKTVVGVTVDTLGSGARTISAVGCGLYYGNSVKDVADNSMDGAKKIFDNYSKGISGSETIKTAAAYVEGVETDTGKYSGAFVKAGFQTVIGTGKVADTAGWAVDGIMKNTVGLFTGMAKGIYKVADTQSTTKDVIGGVVDIGLSCVGGSKVIIKASQIPGLLKGGAQLSAETGSAFLNLVRSAANANEGRAAAGELTSALLARGFTRAEAEQLVGNSAKAALHDFVGKMLASSREAMIKRIRDLIASGATAGMTNAKETIRSSLSDMFSKSFKGSLEGFLKNGTTVMGETGWDYLDNLMASQLDPILSDLIAVAIAGAPDAEQMAGSWTGQVTVTSIEPQPDPGTGKSQGCDLDLRGIIGKRIPIGMKIEMDKSGAGSVAMESGSGSSPGSIKYANGAVRITFSQQKSAMVMDGTAVLQLSGVAMSGTFRITQQGSPTVMSGSWQLTKGK